MIKYYSILFLFALSACQSEEDVQHAQNAATLQDTSFCLSEQLKQTTVLEDIHERPITEQLSLTGKVEYNENDLVAFRSLLDGIVEKVSFELGDYVKKGSVLATVRSNDIQDLLQQKKMTESQITLFENQLATKRELLEDGLTSRPDVLEAEQELAAARIELDRITQSLQLFRSTGDGLFQLIAPKNGYVIQKAISAGQRVTGDDEPLFSISNLKEVWVMVNIYASNLRYVHVGDQVKVRTIAYPDRFYAGKIDKIYNVFDQNEHVLKARVVLENKDLNLMPGLSADIIINKQNAQGTAFAVPNTAKVFNNNKEYVVVYKSDCQLDVRRIHPVASNEEYTFTKEPFAADEKIVCSNALLLFEQLTQ